MILLLSPSKTLDMEPKLPKLTPSEPEFLNESTALIKAARALSPADLKALMGISDKLAELNHARFKAFKTPFTPDNAVPAGYAFRGDVYDGLRFDDFSAKDRDYAQAHLRILSGLYGVLRPLDLMQAYRLEMGIRLANPRGKNLYEFWGERVTQAINAAAKKSRSSHVINLASTEYFSAVKPRLLAVPVITPSFKESKNGTLKIIGLMAKKARGRMASWLIHERVTDAGAISQFDGDGYCYRPDLSSEHEYVFVR